MSFRISVVLNGYEYRGVREGDGKNGHWVSLVTESPDAEQLQVTVPSEMQRDVFDLGLRKGDCVMLPIVAYANNDYNGVRLSDVPRLLDPETGEVL